MYQTLLIFKNQKLGRMCIPMLNSPSYPSLRVERDDNVVDVIRVSIY